MHARPNPWTAKERSFHWSEIYGTAFFSVNAAKMSGETVSFSYWDHKPVGQTLASPVKRSIPARHLGIGQIDSLSHKGFLSPHGGIVKECFFRILTPEGWPVIVNLHSFPL
jgi:hypothetical protein